MRSQKGYRSTFVIRFTALGGEALYLQKIKHLQVFVLITSAQQTIKDFEVFDVLKWDLIENTTEVHLKLGANIFFAPPFNF